MARIVVFTPRQIRRHEDAFARLVGEALATVASEVALTFGTDALVAATTPPVAAPVPPPVGPPAGVAIESLAIISELWAGQVAAMLAPTVVETYYGAATETFELLGTAFPDTVLPAVSDTFAEVYLAQASNRLRGIGDHLWEEIRASLLAGFASGESVEQLRDRIRVEANVSQARANAIARTEIISASNVGSHQQVLIAGLVGTKEWLDTNDSRTRCTHRAASGQTVDVDSKFVLGGELECGTFGLSYLDVPGDPLAPIAERIQCRCSVAYDLDLPPEGALVAAAEVHTGAMIALRMTEADAKRLAVEGFEPPEQLHTTLMYLGDAADLEDEQLDAIFKLVGETATKYEPFSTEAFALNIFNPHAENRDTAVVLGVAGGETSLESIWTDIFTSPGTLPFTDMQHSPWVPHITLGYTEDLAAALEWWDRLGPVTFDRIRLALAGEDIDFPLGRSEALVAAGDHDWDPKEHPKSPITGKFIDVPDVPGSVSISGSLPKPVKGKKVKNLTNAVIYAKHGDGDVIATSDNGSTVVTYDAKANKILINGKPHGKQEAYQKLKSQEGWTLGGQSGGNVAPPTVATSPTMPSPTPPPPTFDAPVFDPDSPTLSSSTTTPKNITVGMMIQDKEGKWIAVGSVTKAPGGGTKTAGSLSGQYTFRDSYGNVIKTASPNEKIKFTSPFASVNTGGVTNPLAPKIANPQSAWAEIKSGDYDGLTIMEAHSSSGQLIARYIVHGNGPDAKLTQEFFDPVDNDWKPYKKFETEGDWHVKLTEMKHSSIKTETIEPKKADGALSLDQFPPGASSLGAKTTITPTSSSTSAIPSSTKSGIKHQFEQADVKWYSDSAKMYAAAQKASTSSGLTLTQVLAIMDADTKTKTSPTPFTDKIQKYLGSKKGKQHAYSLLGTSAVKNKISSGTSSGGGTTAPPKPSKISSTVAYIDSPAALKADGDFKVLGVAGADALKKEMDEQYGPPTPTQRSSLKGYTGSYYVAMNGCLRKVYPCDSTIDKYNANASAGMRPTTRDIKVARGVGYDGFGLKHGSITELQSLVGKTLEEPGFLSTAVTPSSSWSGAIRLEIDVPKGTRGVWAKPFSNHPGENEFILDKGLRYRIKEVLPPSPTHPNSTLVRLEVVPE